MTSQRPGPTSADPGAAGLTHPGSDDVIKMLKMEKSNREIIEFLNDNKNRR